MNSVIVFLKELMPTGIERPWAVGGATVAMMLNSLFPYHEFLVVLVYAIIIDFILGTLASIINPNLLLDSTKWWRGLLKKAAELAIVSFASIAASNYNLPILYYAAVGGYTSVEVLSIIENAGKAGVPVPEKLRKTLAQLAEQPERKG